jgi:hypothetical protein
MMPMLTLNAYPLTTLDQRQSFGLDGIWFCSKEELFSSNLSIAGHLRKKLTEDLVTNHDVILCMLVAVHHQQEVRVARRHSIPRRPRPG